MNGVALASAYGMLSGGLFFWRDAVDVSLVHAFGPRAPAPWPIAAVLALATVLQVLAYELAYWLSHYALHRIPALWEFHKVHHSAEAMTIFTELRQHPVEILLVVNLVGFSTGLVFGAMAYASLHAPRRQRPDDDVSPDLRAPAPQPDVDRLHRAGRQDSAQPGASSAASLARPDPPRQELRLRPFALRLGVRHARSSVEGARTDLDRRRRGFSALPVGRVKPLPPFARLGGRRSAPSTMLRMVSLPRAAGEETPAAGR